MKLVFLGTGDFAVPSLSAIRRAGHVVSLVVTQPDRPQGRGLAVRPTPVKLAADRQGLPVFQPEKLRLEPEGVIAQKAEALVVVAYGQILKENILECAPRGAINVHASLLPKYRGAAPIQWAIANGETQTGVTTMQLDRGMDTGPILLQEECPIGREDSASSLETRLAALGASLLVETLDRLARGSVTPQPQDQSAATNAPLLTKADGVVDFGRNAAEIVDRLRGFSPWPGLQFTHGGRAIKILTAAALPEFGSPSAVPAGAIIKLSRDGLDVACGGRSALRLQRVRPESRGAVSAFDFANGAKLRVGMVFESFGGEDRTARRSEPKD